ncbi:uncharacterized protein LOC111389442 [Olea europaea var. sylvestris]|uniref:uncharacterized protein LOC111389442 n=1 Tax=Olea europaea var. sylvestris TaxID=158386 RepID=UPI000C1D7D89|nr:uncharacterized protein LOC111389442 [Olea europaea var. sylvestris]
MRQRRWLELVKDYDYVINYHPGKANVVADALSRKSTSSVASMIVTQKSELIDLQKMGIEVVSQGFVEAKLVVLTFQPTLLNKIQQGQQEDDCCSKIKNDIQDGEASDFHILAYGILQFRGRLYVPDAENIRGDILSEAHMTPYSVHPGATKMYRDLKLHYWWPNMKVCSTYSMDRYAQLYVQEIVRIHGVPLSIVSDRDSKFVSLFQIWYVKWLRL